MLINTCPRAYCCNRPGIRAQQSDFQLSIPKTRYGLISLNLPSVTCRLLGSHVDPLLALHFIPCEARYAPALPCKLRFWPCAISFWCCNVLPMDIGCACNRQIVSFGTGWRVGGQIGGFPCRSSSRKRPVSGARMRVYNSFASRVKQALFAIYSK